MAKALVLFVHGIDGSSKTTWGGFPALIGADAELSARFDVALDDYPTRLRGHPLKRIGGLDIAAEGLKSRLESHRHDGYEDISVIAHSQGGLIVLRYMLDRLLRTEPMPITRLLTYATPYAGATAGGVGAFIGLGSEQADDLDPGGSFLFRLNRDWALFRHQQRVTMEAVIAGCDGVVGAASAIALGIPYHVAASGNHQTIVKPDSATHESFRIARHFLLGAPIAPAATRALKHAMRLPEAARAELQAAWKTLDERMSQNSNVWREEWDSARERLDAAFARAAETGLAECWQAVIEAGGDLCGEMQEGVDNELDLPVHHAAISMFMVKMQKALKVAGQTPGNALPPAHDTLIADITALEEKTGDERGLLTRERAAASVSVAKQGQIEELLQRLGAVEADLATSKSKAVEAEEVNRADADPAAIRELIREALEALEHGIDLLDDTRFTERLRRGALATWRTARRYVGAVRGRFSAVRLLWRQEPVFDAFEHREPRFGLAPQVVTPRFAPSGAVTFPVWDRGVMRQESRIPGDGVSFRDSWEHRGEVITAPEMVVIPSGTFMMGSPEDEPERRNREGPQHRVTISTPFAVGRYPVISAEYLSFFRINGIIRNVSDPNKNNHPATHVSWYDAKAYISWLNGMAGGEHYRMLSEAEWEYCCRAGSITRYVFGYDIRHYQANFERHRRGTTPVDSYPSNNFGLCDMHGNVWEWVEDAWHETYEGAPNDGSAWTAGDIGFRVLRGGSWGSGPLDLRAANRSGYRPSLRDYFLGFRIARTLNP